MKNYCIKYITIILLTCIYIPKAIAHYDIRLASPEDLNVIMELDNDVSNEYFKPLLLQYSEFKTNPQAADDLLSKEIENEWLWLADCIAKKNQQRLFVAYHDKKCVGFVATHLYDNHTIVIDLIILDVAYRRKGIGTQLIKTCIQEFPDAHTCMLIVLSKNEIARRSYEKAGFKCVSEKPSFFQEKYPESRYLCYAKCL